MPSSTMDALSAQLKAAVLRADPDHVDELVTETAHVYMRHSTSSPPAHPGKGWTRFVCISDTHGSTPPVPYGDVLIHAGDLSTYGRRKSWLTSLKFLRDLPHPVKLVIAGNHDRLLDPELYPEGAPDQLELLSTVRDALTGPEALKHRIQYMQYQSTTLDDGLWEVYGSPSWEGGSFAYGDHDQGTPLYSNGAFQYEEREAEDVNALIPTNTQILMTHGPPYGVLDGTRRGKTAGCPSLAHRLFATPSTSSSSSRSAESSSSSQPQTAAWLPAVRLHVFGHIHEAWGAKIITRSPPSAGASTLASKSKLNAGAGEMPSSTQSSPSRSSRRIDDEPPATSQPPLQAIETVFVNAALQSRGVQAIIVDLKNLPAEQC